jgi:hypothetical protein
MTVLSWPVNRQNPKEGTRDDRSVIPKAVKCFHRAGFAEHCLLLPWQGILRAVFKLTTLVNSKIIRFNLLKTLFVGRFERETTSR